MKVSDYIALYLEKRGVRYAFELVGGMITFLLDSLSQKTKIQVISMHHEQGAGFAAEGIGRMSGTPGVALATSGPGATNLLTAIGSCYFDSVPTIFITGQVNRHEQKGNKPIRQLGFQETDIVSMAKPITKASWTVTNPEDIPALLEDAFNLTMSGRPGPVLIDVPMDVQRAEIDGAQFLKLIPEIPALPFSAGQSQFFDSLKAALTVAQRPLVLVGGGVRSPRVTEPVRALLDILHIPVVHSLMGVDVLPWKHPLRVGLIGSYGNRWANIALSESDFLLVLGSRLDIRQTGADVTAFKDKRVIFHIDCDSGELNNRIQGCETLVSDLGAFATTAATYDLGTFQRSLWSQRIETLRNQWPDTRELDGIHGINPNMFLHLLSCASMKARAFISDVGQHQMWAAQSLEFSLDQRFLTSGGMGAMGFALPCAIGACFAANGAPVVVIAGDGGFQLNIQELQTIVQYGLPIKIVILNNGCHGMVRQFQESYFKGRYQSTVWGYSAPVFTKVAKAYGIEAQQVFDEKDILAALEILWQSPDKPYLLEVLIPQSANAYPKMAFGRPISEMEPFAKPLEMEGT